MCVRYLNANQDGENEFRMNLPSENWSPVYFLSSHGSWLICQAVG